MTDDRIRFTQTLNLANDAPRRAVAEMIYTAEHAGELKASSGVKSTGRKLDKPVYTFSLSWHPSEKPTDDQMRDAASDALKALKMQDHQVLMVAHNDTEHPHIHLMVNRVHPETGIAHPLKNDHMILSKWAEKYEKEHGKTWCAERVKNNAERHQATFAKARGQAAKSFVKDRKSQERDARPEYDRRAKAIQEKRLERARLADRARQAGNTAQATARAAHPRETGREAAITTEKKAIAQFLAARKVPSVAPIAPTSPTGEIAPALLNAQQVRHLAERDALAVKFEKRLAEAKALLEDQYGESRRKSEKRLAELVAREEKGSFMSKAVDRFNGVPTERLALQKSLADIRTRSDELLLPILRERRAAAWALRNRQDDERRDLNAVPAAPEIKSPANEQAVEKTLNGMTRREPI